MRLSSSVALTGLVAWNQVAAKPCPSIGSQKIKQIELGPRPYYLVDDMDDSPLKTKLASCKNMAMKPSSWTIGHRGGGPLQFPEESEESNLAGARMGAGVLECDVGFTKDRELVCRHSQCDLHTTTNIVNIPELNAKCTTPFEPAADGKPAKAKCCTSDITLAEFKTLCGKMDGFNATATTAEDYLHGTPNWRTDLYATCGTVLSHHDHIALVNSLGLEFTPELKQPLVEMPFQGNYTNEMFAQQMIDDYKKAGLHPSRVYPQSFQYEVIQYWLKKEPKFGKQAVLLDQSADPPKAMAPAIKNLTRYADDGLQFIAPSMSYLVKPGPDGSLVASDYAKRAKELGLKIITWSLERSPPIADVHENGDYYYFSIQDVVKKDGDIYKLVDALHHEVGVYAMFSDWAATVTYYANCFGIKV